MRAIVTAAILVLLSVPASAEKPKPVEVLNPPDQAVPVQQPREPVNFLGYSVALLSGETHDEAVIYTVPAERRLVIEHVFFRAFGDSTTCSFVAMPSFRLDAVNYYMNPIPTFQTDDGFRGIGSQAMKLYGEPGSAVVAVFHRDTGAPCTASGSFVFSGYLEEDLQ